MKRNGSSTPLISVIIPTFDRPDDLRRCLRSLSEQDCASYEVIVADNAACDETRRIVAAATAGTVGNSIRYVAEAALGLHNARHAGARAARGDILVFTDDDATFAPGWLSAYAHAFAANPAMAAAGGPVRPAWQAAPPQWLLELMTDRKTFSPFSLMEPYTEMHVSSHGFFYGVNMAIRRDTLFQVGGFNPEAFGPTWLGDGESGLNRKLWNRNLHIGYVPAAVVYHHIPIERMTMRYLRKRAANGGAADTFARYRARMPGRLEMIGDILRLARQWSLLSLRGYYAQIRFRRRPLAIQLRAVRTISQIRYTLRCVFDRSFRELILRTDWLST